MDNILYRFIADRNTPILDNIERYCISENKDKLTVVRIVFDFLESIKPQLDNSFVRVCMEHIAKDANENTKKTLLQFDASRIQTLKGCEDISRNTKEILKKVEGGKGNITELMYFLINSDKTEQEKVLKLETMVGKAKDWIYIALLTDLYTSESSGVKVEYVNHLGSKVTHIYTRLEFIQDIEMVNARYNDLAKENQNKPKANNVVPQNINKQNISYKEIFRSPWKENTADFERILEINGYINTGQWVGESKKKTELAELYYCLKEHGVIAQDSESNQLNLLYNQFGLTVGKDNTINGEYCTIRALRKADGESDTKNRFDRIFKRWIDRHFT